MSPARIVAIAVTFLILLAGFGAAFYFAFDSIALAIAPAAICAAALAAAVYFFTDSKRRSSR